MQKDYYEMLVFLRDCPDYAISKEIMFNALKWSYSKIDYVIDDLLQSSYIEKFNYWHENFDRYKITYKGQVYINDYESKQNSKKQINSKNKEVKSSRKLSLSTIIDLLLNIFGK